MLKFHHSWRFESPGKVPEEACRIVFKYAKMAARHTKGKQVIERFKLHFADASSNDYHPSSSLDWAETDLNWLIGEAATNAPLFIEALHDSCDDVRKWGAPVPDVSVLNRVLREHGTGFEIDGSRVIRSAEGRTAVPVSAPSVSERVRARIQQSLDESQRLLDTGRHRQAVQEVLWLMETVTTAFKGTATPAGSVAGKYFVRILKDVRRLHRGSTFEEISRWIERLYGFLSSPTGGGVRHGTDIAELDELDELEARLYCDLIRSYTQFLLATHEQLDERTNR